LDEKFLGGDGAEKLFLMFITCTEKWIKEPKNVFKKVMWNETFAG
jgi:hypothetical protein